MEIKKELLEKARQAKSPEELAALAKENGIELSSEQAAAYFAKLGSEDNGLSDDELDNVAGGGCGSEEVDYRIKVCPTGKGCIYYVCAACGKSADSCSCRPQEDATCGTCTHIRHKSNGQSVCNSPYIRPKLPV